MSQQILSTTAVKLEEEFATKKLLVMILYTGGHTNTRRRNRQAGCSIPPKTFVLQGYNKDLMDSSPENCRVPEGHRRNRACAVSTKSFSHE